MNYKKEFPDFDYIPLLATNDNWHDASYHNDTCPSFEKSTPDSFIIKVFFDYEDTKKREDEEDNKFYVALYDKDDIFLKSILTTDHESDLLQLLTAINGKLGASL